MNQGLSKASTKKPNADCAGLASMAERELTAFFGAVTALFGAEQAEASAEEWLQELDDIKDVPVSAREFRSITTKVTNRLTKQVSSLAAAS